MACSDPAFPDRAKLGSLESQSLWPVLYTGETRPENDGVPGWITVSSPPSHYALGSADAEHERLIRQAVWLAPYSERCFREAGIGLGQRVLEVGSGVGDVALLLARLVGPSGEVVGVERDTRSIGRARARVAEAGLHNVQFIESDVAQVRSDEHFDAAVGRYILMFLPDPASVLRSLSQFVRLGGVLVFQEEASYASFLDLAALRLAVWVFTLVGVSARFL